MRDLRSPASVDTQRPGRHVTWIAADDAEDLNRNALSLQEPMAAILKHARPASANSFASQNVQSKLESDAARILCRRRSRAKRRGQMFQPGRPGSGGDQRKNPGSKSLDALCASSLGPLLTPRDLWLAA